MGDTPLTSREALQTVEAIRRGEVDAFVVAAEEEDRVFVLQSADRLHRMIVESMGEGAVTLSNDGAITYCNPHFVKLLGRERDDLLGRRLRDLVAEETRDVFDALLARSEANDMRAEISLTAADREIPVAVASTVFSDSDGSHYCLIVNDLRDQRAREQLRTVKEAAEVASRAKDDFLAMVSHELRSPITVILGWTRMLQMNRVDRDTLTLAVDNIHQSTARLLKLVDDILDASRLRSGKVALQPKVIDLRDNVRASVEAIRFDVDRKGIAVSLRVPETPVYVHGDPERLQQVIVNLLTNAVKFTPAAGRVEVDLQTRRDHAHLHVTDDGEGIDPSFLPFVFERFRQDNTSTTRTNKGLGLGLAIVKQLIEAHDGAVAAHSDGKGLGARFTVSLPITKETAHRQTAAPPFDPLPSLDAIRVLLVDDEPETVEVMRTILHAAGATVGTATSVAYALDLAASFDPDVVVTDIAMPGEDGFQFLRRLSVRGTDRAAIPVLAITGKTTADDRDEILAAGFRAYLRKPIEPAELIRAIAALAAPR